MSEFVRVCMCNYNLLSAHLHLVLQTCRLKPNTTIIICYHHLYVLLSDSMKSSYVIMSLALLTLSRATIWSKLNYRLPGIMDLRYEVMCMQIELQ